MDRIGILRRIARACRGPVDADDPGEADLDLIREVAPFFDRLCTRWYRLEVDGLERAPDGPALLVMNHDSGMSTVELLGFGGRWYAGRGPEDALHALGHDAMFRMPGIGPFLVRAGGVRATHANAERIFGMGRKVLVAPGGNLEANRPFSERRLVKFGGRTGFLKLAVRNRVPIVPVVFCGGHEGWYVVSDGQPLVRALDLHRRLRVDTWPLSLSLPWGVFLGPTFYLPLPTKVSVRLLDPIPTAHLPRGAEDDPRVLRDLYDVVTGAMQTALSGMYDARRWPVIG